MKEINVSSMSHNACYASRFVVVYLDGNRYLTNNRRLSDNVDKAKVFSSLAAASSFVSRDLRCGFCRICDLSVINRHSPSEED